MDALFRLESDAGSPLIEGLNAEQAQAVLSEAPALLIFAGAGSGKTRVLTHRIAHLLESGRARPHEVLAITFTNKAAGEMRERVQSLVGPEARQMWVSTFHSACVRILRRDYELAGLRSTFSIYDSADSTAVMKLVMNELDLDPKKFNPKALLGRVGKYKDELIGPDIAAASATMASKFSIEYAAGLAYGAYQRRLEAANAVDFDDIIVKTVRLLQAHPEVATRYRAQFKHVLVDEYQDTNHAQYVLVRELVGEHGSLTVVGDADQSIYAFRGANIRNILEFEKDYPDAEVIRLERNYRSTQNILTAANAVISNNVGRPPKNLWTDAGEGERIIGYAADNEQDEALFISSEIARLTSLESVAPADIAIMYRANAQSRAIEERFIRAEIPYKVVGGTRFYERKEIKDMLAYLAAVANEDDDVATRRIINTPRRGIGDTTVDSVERLRRDVSLAAARSGERGLSFGAALRRADEAGLATRSLKPVQDFVSLMDDLRSLAADNGPAGILDAIADRTGMLRAMRVSDDPQDASRIENIMELVSVGREFSEENPEGTLVDFLEKVALVADADQIPDADGGGGGGVVTLMTLHTAKGLEFPVVFVVGLEDGTFPHMRSIESGDLKDLEEERRLAYVGLTRAMQRLYLTRAEVRSAWGAPQYLPASRFVDEIPADLVDWRRSETTMSSLRARTERRGAGGWSSTFGGSQDRDDGNSYGRAGAVSTRSVPPSPPGADGGDIGFEVGERVNHDSFGMGKVVGSEGFGRNAVVKVDFGDAGVKRLVLRFNSLTKL